MKYGYSNLLTETIEAAVVEYDDCRTFQIVCPICREPVFKSVREQPAAIHYLSHYQAAQAYAADCELRVGRFDPNEIEQQNIVSRGQKLRFFLTVFSAALPRAFITKKEAASLGRLPEIRRSKALLHMFRFLELVKHSPGDWEGILEGSRLDLLSRFPHPSWSRYGYERQLLIARDMWTHLKTEPARPNLQLLWSYGVVQALEAGADEVRADIGELLRLSKKRGLEYLGWLETRKSSADPDNDRLGAMTINIWSGMTLTLLTVPYADILREQMVSGWSR